MRLLWIAAGLQLLWGLVPSASRFVIEEIPVELYIALRWTISGAVFAVYLALTKRFTPVSGADAARVALLGLLGYGLASFAMLYGLKIGGVTNFALIAALGPVVSASMAILVLRERPRKLFYPALGLSVCGLLLLVLAKHAVSTFAVAGTSAALILGGCVLEGLVFVYSKRFRASMSTFQYIAIAQFATALVLWLSQGLVFHQTAELAHLSARGFAAALFVSLVACVFCYSVLYWLLSRIDGHRLALFDGFHALSATFFGVVLFHEVVGPLALAGGALVLAGIVLGNLPEPSPPAEA